MRGGLDTDWYGHLSFQNYPKLKQAIFSEEVPAVVAENGKHFTLKVLQEIPATLKEDPSFNDKLELLKEMAIDEHRVTLLLNELVEEKNIQFLWDKIDRIQEKNTGEPEENRRRFRASICAVSLATSPIPQSTSCITPTLQDFLFCDKSRF